MVQASAQKISLRIISRPRYFILTCRVVRLHELDLPAKHIVDGDAHRFILWDGEEDIRCVAERIGLHRKLSVGSGVWGVERSFRQT